jgi:quinohemoprotein ethanol dehydrogenase
MRRSLFIVVAAGLLAGATVALASASSATKRVPPAAISEAAGNWLPAGTVPCGSDWPNPGCDLAGSRFSPNTQLNPTNVAGLKMAWQQSYNGPTWTGNTESQPIVVSGAGKNLPLESGTMFMDIQAGLLALDPTTGNILWSFQGPLVDNLTGVKYPSFRVRAAYGNGMVFDVQEDRSLVALNAKTGAVIWTNQLSSVGTFPGSHQNGPGFAMFYNDGKDGIVISANNSGDGPLRGHEDAFNAKTGKLLWRFWNTPDPTQFPYILSWGGAANAAYGGAAIWSPPAFDPKLGLMYFGTGNAYPETGRAPGQSLWSDSIVAISIKTGVMKWYWQGAHHDITDEDCPTPPVLMNTMMAGKVVPAVAFSCKQGYVFVFNRANGAALPTFPHPEMPIPNVHGANAAAAVALNNAWPTQPVATGGAAQLSIHCPTVAEATAVYPSYPVAANGTPMQVACPFAVSYSNQYVVWGVRGTDYPPMSYDPLTNDLYVCSDNNLTSQENLSSTDFHVSQIGGSQAAGWTGAVSALNMSTNKLDWQVKYQAAGNGLCYSGVVSTAGNLVFAASKADSTLSVAAHIAAGHTNYGGTLYAYNAKTGAQLWSWQAPDVIYSAPITYMVKGKQYVALMVNGPAIGPLATGKRDLLTVFSL